MKNRSKNDLAIAAGQNIKEKEYWIEKLSGELNKTYFYFDFGKTNKEAEMDIRTLRFTGELFARLIKMSRESNYVLNVILISALVLLLNKYTGNNDILVGTPIYKQNINEEFINTLLVLRNRAAADHSFKDILLQVRQTVSEAEENQNYPFEVLSELLGRPFSAGAGESPLFDVMILLENIHDREYVRHVKTNMVFSFLRKEESIEGKVEFNALSYAPSTIERIIGHFRQVLQQVLSDPDVRLSDVDVLTEAEKKRLLFDFNATAAAYPEGKTIQALFREQVERNPHNIAIIGTKKQEKVYVTYETLDRETDELAVVLTEKGVGAGTIAALLTNRSFEMIVGIFGILKAGGAYLPIEPDSPDARKSYLLKESRAALLLTTRNLTEEIGSLRDLSIEIIYIEENNRQEVRNSQGGSGTGAAIVPPASDIAYVIYTSGSTGNPKGVLVRHSSVVNIISDLQNRYPLEETDTYLFKTSYIFDVSVAELFGWFPAGGRLALLDDGAEKEPAKIFAAVENFTVTHINFVPSMFNVFVDELNESNIARLAALKYIFLAGEALLPELVNKFRQFDTQIKLENIYGPTEGTVYTCNYPLSDWDGKGSIPIGKPMRNIRLYILNRDNQLQPPGVPGELYIAGEGVACGYLNRPELTAEKFIWGMGCERLYKTGDLVRRLPDGNIEYLGRMDFQVKIRGFRIELGEIENCLLKHETVRDTVVVDREREDGEKYLCAYIVLHKSYSGQDEQDLANNIREYLSLSLPGYMIPFYFVFLKKIPLNQNGKVIRRNLPQANGSVSPFKYSPPTNESQEKLLRIWSDVLQINASTIGIDAHFFEMGGHSLKAAILIAGIYKEFQTQLSLSDIFKSPTIRGLAELINAGPRDKNFTLRKIEKKDYYPLSSAQKRLFFLKQMDETNILYNIPAVFLLEGKLDKGKLSDTFRALIRRHESFRTFFLNFRGEPVQRIKEDVDFEMEYFETDGTQQVIHQFVRSFDLSKAPLLRVGLVKSEEERHILIVDMHHIVSDGISIAVLVREFMALQAGRELPQGASRYIDFSTWQNAWSRGDAKKKQERFWLDTFAGEPSKLRLPYDYPEPRHGSNEGNIVFSGLDKKLTAALKELAAAEDVTLFMLLLAIFNIVLAKLSGQIDILVGTPVNGRRHFEILDTIGMFVNTLVLRNFPAKEKRFNDFLKEIKERTLAAFENRDYPFEDLVESLNIAISPGGNPIFDVMFLLQNVAVPVIEIPGLKLTDYTFETGTAKFDMMWVFEEEGENIKFLIEYKTALFSEKTIERFIVYFKEIVATIVEYKEVILQDIHISHPLLIAVVKKDETEFGF